MLRRRFNAAFVLSLCLLASSALALSVADLTNQDASSGLKAALDKGSVAAVGKLGVENGFLGNDKVKIQLPGLLEKALLAGDVLVQDDVRRRQQFGDEVHGL